MPRTARRAPGGMVFHLLNVVGMNPCPEPRQIQLFRGDRLRPNEEIVAFLEGYIGRAFGSGTGAQVNGVLILTDQRVVFYKKGVFNSHITGIDLNEISSVDQSSGLLSQTVSVRSHAVTLEFTTFSGKAAFRDVVNRIDAQRNQLRSFQAAPMGLAEELRKLSALQEEGILTPGDFERAKSLYLGKTPTKQDETTKLLRNLFELRRVGALSESEFNMKKWDILSRP